MVETVKLQDGICTKKITSAPFMGAMGNSVRIGRPGVELPGTTIQQPIPIACHVKGPWNGRKMGFVAGNLMDEGDWFEQGAEVLRLR